MQFDRTFSTLYRCTTTAETHPRVSRQSLLSSERSRRATAAANRGVSPSTACRVLGARDTACAITLNAYRDRKRRPPVCTHGAAAGHRLLVGVERRAARRGAPPARPPLNGRPASTALIGRLSRRKRPPRLLFLNLWDSVAARPASSTLAAAESWHRRPVRGGELA